MGDKNNNIYYQGEVKREYILFGDYIFEGLGSLIYPDGDKYVGEYKNGKRNGQGTETSPDGMKCVGEWNEGRNWNTTGYDKVGNIISKTVNGKLEWTKAVSYTHLTLPTTPYV